MTAAQVCRRCTCGAELPSQKRRKCDACVRLAKRKQIREKACASVVRMKSECAGPKPAGHDERLALYTARAALGLPLFEGGDD